MIKEISYPCIVEETVRKLIFEGRNKLWIADWIDLKVAVKSFGHSFLNGFEYIIRKSKARRSFENAIRLIERGIHTPAPIAYREERSLFTNRLISSSYICLYEDSKPLKDFFDRANPVFIEAFAQFIAFLHENGVRHDDLNNTNVRVSIHKERYLFSLIDLNRMHFYRRGHPVPLNECFENVTRFSCMNSSFLHFIEEYLKARKQPLTLREKMIKTKQKHDRNVDRKKRIKR